MNDIIGYIPSEDEPLSSDVVIIKGEKSTWLYDVGASENAFSEISEISGEVNAVISHFHPDHILNLKRLNSLGLYLGKNTLKYVGRGQVVENELTINDGTSLRLIPFPSSHAKGCLALELNGEIIFLGDALCPQLKGGRCIYNVQHIVSQISILESSPASLVALGHEGDRHIPKNEILSELRGLLSLRDKNSSEIETDFIIR